MAGVWASVFDVVPVGTWLKRRRDHLTLALMGSGVGILTSRRVFKYGVMNGWAFRSWVSVVEAPAVRTRFPCIVHLVADICTWLCSEATSFEFRTKHISVGVRLKLIVYFPISRTVLGQAEDAAKEAYVGVLRGPGVLPLTLGLLIIVLGVMGEFTNLGGLFFTLLDSAVRVSLMLRIPLQRLSE